MKKIILPTDFSDNALNAIDYAMQLFKDEVCAFFILNVYAPMIYSYEYQVDADQYMMDAVSMVKKNSQIKLDDLLISLKKKYKNSKHTFANISSFNTLTDAITELSEIHDIDMIVMGTKGASKAREILFGSNTIHVLKKSICPVLAIPENFDFEAPKEILFPTDYKIPYQLNELSSVLDIANMYNPRVNILHVFYGDELSENQKKNKSAIDTYFNKIAHLFHDVSNQKIPQAIEKFQLRAKINLLVMINRRHTFFERLFSESPINEVALHLHIPLLVIPIK